MPQFPVVSEPSIAAVTYLPTAMSAPIKQRKRGRLPADIVDARDRFQARAEAVMGEQVERLVAKLAPAVAEMKAQCWADKIHIATNLLIAAKVALNDARVYGGLEPI